MFREKEACVAFEDVSEDFHRIMLKLGIQQKLRCRRDKGAQVSAARLLACFTEEDLDLRR